MKKDKKPNSKKPSPTPAAAQTHDASGWMLPAMVAVTAVAAFLAYAPALGGPFLFDDLYLPFLQENFSTVTLAMLARGVRPVLMVSYQLNFDMSGVNPAGYHLFNLLLHLGTALFAGLIVRRYLALAGVEEKLSRAVAFLMGGVFLLHPLQTESVAYVAGRSETLSVFFVYAAWAAFVCRKSPAIGYVRAIVVILLYGLAVLSKEHAAVLPAVFILSDLYFGENSPVERLKRNWKLYAPVIAAGVAGAWFIARILRMSDTVGFRMKDVTWSDYFFTECRAIWVYVRMFLLPFGQNVDPEFPFSRSILDHGAIVGLIGLLLWAGAALYFRKRFPTASFGTLVFFVFLAPTSSFLPIADPFAERRLYLPMIGLLLITAEFVPRWKAPRKQLLAATAAVLVICALLTWQRNHVWTSALALWEDTVEKSPNKFRPHSQLAFAYYDEGRCADAASEYAKAAQFGTPDTALYMNWALSEDCAGNFQKSVDVISEGIARHPTAHGYATLGMFYAKHGDDDKALDALAQAEKTDDQFFLTYVYRANLYMRERRFDLAAAQFRKAVDLKPLYTPAHEGLAAAEAALRAQPVTNH